MGDKQAVLSIGDARYSLDLVEGTDGNRGVDINTLRAETGLVALDHGFANTASCESAVSYVDGNVGRLTYRGYGIEQLAERSSFIEVAYLLFHGELPNRRELDAFRTRLTRHTILDESLKRLFEAFPRDAHPMAVLSSAVSAMSTYYPELTDPQDPEAVEEAAIRLLAKLPTVAAFSYKKSIGQPYMYPKNALTYCARFLHMMFARPNEEYHVDPLVADALDLSLIHI